MTFARRMCTHLLAAWCGWHLARGARWWADHVPSHNSEELP